MDLNNQWPRSPGDVTIAMFKKIMELDPNEPHEIKIQISRPEMKIQAEQSLLGIIKIVEQAIGIKFKEMKIIVETS